jgi:hypothetical protein
MKQRFFLLLTLFPVWGLTQDDSGLDRQTLIQIIFVLSALLVLVLSYEIWRLLKSRNSGSFSRLFRKVKLEVSLGKDRLFRPQVLTLTIRNVGKREADLEAPVLEFKKIWSRRKFKLNGTNGQQMYPMYLGCGMIHQLHLETATFHQYDRSIKSYYWARIYVSDVEGRRWRSNSIKLRKSLIT